MYGLSLHLTTRTELAQRTQLAQLQLPSEYLASCLPRAEAYLNENSQILQLLQKHLRRRRYRSVMDAVLVRFCPSFEADLRRYYADKGPQLRRLVGAKKLKAIDAHLLNSLRLLRKCYDEFVQQELWAKGKSHSMQAFAAALEAVGWTPFSNSKN